MVLSEHLNPTGLDWQRFTVAVTPDDEIIGCVQAKPHAGGVIELASLVTQPAWRGQGIAGALIAHLQERYPGGLYLQCRAKLGGFYVRYGFRQLAPQEMPQPFRTFDWLINGLLRWRGRPPRLLVMHWQTAD